METESFVDKKTMLLIVVLEFYQAKKGAIVILGYDNVVGES